MLVVARLVSVTALSIAVALPAAAETGASAGRASLLLFQIAVTLAAAIAVSRAVRWIGQPRVIGEILAGIFLGPTLLGALWPDAEQLLFPASSLAPLRVLAEVGVILFMFGVGLHLDRDQLRQHKRAAAVISHVSIIVPFVLGAALAKWLHPEHAPPGTPFIAFALFLGVAMSITAFPVLARILAEHDLMGTPVAGIALTAAAADDATAWFLLALVAAIAQSQAVAGAVMMLAAALAFACLMILAVKPLLGRIRVTDAGALLILFASAATAELIGIHAIFGAFLAGAVIPRDSVPGRTLTSRLEAVNVVLLPLFFAHIGLKTDLLLLVDARTAALAILVIAVATIGKLGGSSLAARLTGSTAREALVIGTLMNTRGLVELIAVNIAYELGVISRTMFSILVLMAVATTFATSPLLRLWKRLDETEPIALGVSRAE